MSAVKGGGKVRAAGAAWPGKRAPLPVARALRILAAAIAPATEPRCPLAHRGPKPPASARTAHGRRFAPAGSGAGLSWRLDRPIYRAPYRAGGGNAVRFLFPPALAKALPPLQWQGPSPLPQRPADPWPAGGQSPRPAPAPPAVGAAFCCACPNARHGTVVPDRAAKTRGVSGSARNGSRLPRIRKALPCGSQSGCPSGTQRWHAPLRYCRRWPLTKRPFSLNSSVEVSVSSDPSTALANRPIIIRALIA